MSGLRCRRTGSALLGFLQFFLAAAISPLVGVMGEDTALPMGVAMLGSIVLPAVAFGFTRERSQDPSVEKKAPATA